MDCPFTKNLPVFNLISQLRKTYGPVNIFLIQFCFKNNRKAATTRSSVWGGQS